MSPRRLLARIARGTGLAVLALLVAGSGVWGALLLEYAGPRNVLVHNALVFGFSLAAAAALIALFVRRWRWRAIGAYGVLCAGLAVLWSTIEPTNERDWQPEVAVLPSATIVGDRVTVHNIRNFDYRSETDFTPAYYDKSFDLRELQSVDIVTSYWMGPAIAHVFVSFGFKGDDYLAVSIEARKAKGEGYSTLKGFFRQTSSCTSWPTSVTSFDCGPTTATIHPRMCTSTGSRVRLRLGGGCSWSICAG